ncbi:MAG: chorismate mutase [Peptococcaceae bacterium]|jgi:chorismate mutase|nr:chorismate mutase [Peptococcaceae bacterium]
MIRGIRGAITVEENTAAAMAEATQEMLRHILERNQLDTEVIASALFTVTADLDAMFPATAAREIGWDQVPMMCTNEIPVPGSLRRCIRVLLQVNTAVPQSDIRHVYLRKAVVLREDLNN